MEPQPPKTDRCGLAVSASYLGNATRHLWTTRPSTAPSSSDSAHARSRRPLHHVLHDRKYHQRRRLNLENPVSRPILRLRQQIDTRRHSQLQRSAPFRSAARGAWRHDQRELHLVALHQRSVAGDRAEHQRRPGLDDPNNRRIDRGNCTDIRNRSPAPVQFVGRRRNAAVFQPTLRLIGSGWRISPIFKVLSGGYLTITTNQDRALNGMPTSA